MNAVIVANGPAGDDDTWTQVNVVEGERSEVLLRAAPRAVLAGRVREAGKVLPGATLRLEKDSAREAGPGFVLPGMSRGPEARSDGEGRYRVDDVQTGRYTLTVEHPTRRMPTELEVELREGENTFDVDLPLSIVSGRIVDDEGKGLAGVRVWPERAEPEGGRRMQMRMVMVDDSGGAGVFDSGQFGERALTDAEGRYTLRGVATDVDLVVRAEGDEVQPGRSGSVRVAPDETRADVDIALSAAGSILVEARLSDGAPARFQLVQAEFLGTDEPRPEPKFSFLQEGSTVLRGLKPGRWRVNVRSAQSGPPGSGESGQDQEIEVRPREEARASFEVE
jgi:hypothetical protein